MSRAPTRVLALARVLAPRRVLAPARVLAPPATDPHHHGMQGWVRSMSWVLLCVACRPRGPEPESTPAYLQSAAGGGAAAPSASAPARAAAWHSAVGERQAQRQRMVEEQLRERGIADPRVLAAMGTVPRHRFVPESVRQLAYRDGPLPIPGDQTISQPYMVAAMSEAAAISAGERCLEIGTGSGYQAAILAELCAETYSIEYLPEVAAFGRGNLEALGYLQRGVSLRVGDGYAGWPERAPFDAILVTAAPEQVPRPLLEQLSVGGRLVIPVGPDHEQRLEVWTRRRAGRDAAAFEQQVLFGVRFVPFLGPGVQQQQGR